MPTCLYTLKLKSKREIKHVETNETSQTLILEP